MHGERAPSPLLLGALVALAVVTVSLAAIFVRQADAPAVTISFWRNAIGALALLPFAFARRHELPHGRAFVLLPLAGLTLALHFALWIASLAYTTVAASVVLVCTQPVFVALFAFLLLRERISSMTAAGIAIAICGAVIIGGEDLLAPLMGGVSVDAGPPRPDAWWGNVLALLGAVAVAAYVLLGRRSRTTDGVPLVVYTFVVYASAALVLLVMALAFGDPLVGFSDDTWVAIGALALLPQLLGHTLLNWALRYVRASILSSTILFEPVIATVLAWMVLDEVPSAWTIGGGVVVLAGLVVVMAGRNR
jgi:drug/metabolite transporter (DMT)-like permease